MTNAPYPQTDRLSETDRGTSVKKLQRTIGTVAFLPVTFRGSSPTPDRLTDAGFSGHQTCLLQTVPTCRSGNDKQKKPSGYEPEGFPEVVNIYGTVTIALRRVLKMYCATCPVKLTIRFSRPFRAHTL